METFMVMPAKYVYFLKFTPVFKDWRGEERRGKDE